MGRLFYFVLLCSVLTPNRAQMFNWLNGLFGVQQQNPALIPNNPAALVQPIFNRNLRSEIGQIREKFDKLSDNVIQMGQELRRRPKENGNISDSV